MRRYASLAPRAQAKAPEAAKRPVLQPKLDISPARDRFEAEADRIADSIVSGRQGPASAAPSISPLGLGGLRRMPATATPPLKQEVETRKIEDEEPEKETQVQRRADGPGHAPASAERSIARMQASGGSPLSPSVRSPMEQGLGRSLSGIRVHDSAAAHVAARAVGAQAFTVGNHVFFGRGRYRPETPTGQRLLGHELVHTQQQKALGQVAQRLLIQRNGEEDGEPPADANDLEEEEEALREWTPRRGRNKKIELNETRSGGQITLPAVKIPTLHRDPKGILGHRVKAGWPDPNYSPITETDYIYEGKNPRGSDTARQQFLRNAYFEDAELEIETPLFNALPKKVDGWEEGRGIREEGETEDRFYLHRKRESPTSVRSIIIGTQTELSRHELIKIPDWNRRGRYAAFDVDHAQELQLGGLDDWDNFWLLGQRANRSSGTKINAELKKAVDDIIKDARDESFFAGENVAASTSFSAIKDQPPGAGLASWTVKFKTISGLSISGDRSYWLHEEIGAGEHLGHLKAMTPDQVAAEGLVADGNQPSHVSVFAKRTGGFRMRWAVNEDGTIDLGDGEGFQGFTIDSAVVTSDPNDTPYIKKLGGTIFRRSDPVNQRPVAAADGIAVTGAAGLGFSGYLDQAAINRIVRELGGKATGTSPIAWEDAGINGEGILYANGNITASKLLFPGYEIPITVYGNDVHVAFPIPATAMSMGPVTVTETTLQIGVSDGAFFLQGQVGVAIDSVGSGLLTARYAEGNTLISGDFDFDVDFLDPASAGFVYDFGADTLTLTLNAGVGQGVLPGVERGEVHATFSREAIDINGMLFMGGMLSGTEVTISYSRENGLALGADNIALPVESIPGVSSATASLHANRDPQSGEWSFGGGGVAQISVAGVTGPLAVTVDGDQVTIAGGPLTVTKGPATGTLAFMATNAAIDDEGNPIEGQLGEGFTVWGRGSVEVTFGDVLTGRAAITLSPDASVQIEGTIGLPPTFEVFPIQRFERDLLHVETPDFPIWGVSVAGVGFGIFAFADADLGFNAFVGPGQLVDTEVTAAMDLDAPQDATVAGSARFVVPAGAGLTLDIGGGLRARATVAFVEGRVGLDGELGLEADASAGVDVAWNRNDGLSVDAEIDASARPKFRIGVNARVRAGVDLGIKEVAKTWGPWQRTLGEFGPDMEMGITIPARWSEAEGVDFALSDIEVRQPQINARDILKSAFEELV